MFCEERFYDFKDGFSPFLFFSQPVYNTKSSLNISSQLMVYYQLEFEDRQCNQILMKVKLTGKLRFSAPSGGIAEIAKR